MPDITIDQYTYEKLRFTALLLQSSPGDVVRTLVERLDAEPHPPASDPMHPDKSDPIDERAAEPITSTPVQQSTAQAQSGWIPVFRVFKQQKYEGEFNPGTHELRITSAPWSGTVYPSPTAAAQAVVDHVPSERETPNTNGRTFWRLTTTGKNLRSIIGQR